MKERRKSNMLESIKHLLGLCGEPHGLAHMLYALGGLLGTICYGMIKRVLWWIEDNVWI